MENNIVAEINNFHVLEMSLCSTMFGYNCDSLNLETLHRETLKGHCILMF